MRLAINRNSLLAAVQLALPAIGRGVNPVLSNVKLLAADPATLATGDPPLTLSATDTEVGIRVSVQGATVTDPGDALLPAAQLNALLKESTDDELTIEADPGGAVIKGRRTEYELPGEDATIFPDWPAFDAIDNGSNRLELPAATLQTLMARTMFAVADPNSMSRYGATTGVLWQGEVGDRLKMVATDGRTLAVATGSTSAGLTHLAATKPIIPLKALQLLGKCRGSEDGETVKVCFRPNEVLFQTPRASVYSRLVEGRFPDWQKAVPNGDAAASATFTGAALARAIRQAAIMTSPESMGVIFSFEPGTPGKVTLAAKGAATGKSRVEMELDYTGKPMEISFDPTYLAAMLRVFDGEAQFTMELRGSDSPAVIRNAERDYLYVVLPLVVRK